MHRLLVLYPPPTDPQAFADYYEGHHLPIAARLPGLRGFRWGLDVAAPGGDSPYFCVFEADFDVPNYATGGAVLLRFDVRQGEPATTGR